MILESGNILEDRYQIDSMIGQGGMSYVYRAHDTRMDRLVAIKVLKEEYCDDEEFIRKFQNEAQAAAKLNHSNIVSAFDVVDDDDRKLHYIVMELVEGITLKTYIQRKGKLNNRETIGIALQLIDGIEQAHKMGIVHRDIKPQNMIINSEGVVKIADFGIARAASQETVNATVMGSVHYISPEQARFGVSDERSDIYSFGCTLYEMLTGKVPYEGDTSVSVLFSHIENQIPKVSELTDEVYHSLDMVVYKCMQKDPEDRYQNIEDIGEDLQRALEDPDGEFVDVDFYSDIPKRREPLSRKKGADREEVRNVKRIENEDINDRLRPMYRVITAICVVGIIALVIFLSVQLYRIFASGTPNIETTSSLETSQDVSESDNSETVAISISELELRLPDIIGMTVSDAIEYLSDYDISIIVSREEFSDVYNEGLIISYPDRSYSAGATIPVTISSGALTITFYDIANPSDLSELNERSFQDVSAMLDERGIEYSYDSEFSDTVIEGNIISVSKADTSMAGDLTFIVSLGSEEDKAQVPDLSDLTVEEATELLEEAGLLLGDVDYETSEEVDVDNIISQSIEEGSVVDMDTEVDIVVSLGTTETTADNGREYWYASLNETINIGTGGPGIDGSMLILVRLRQDIDNLSLYTTLQTARTYSLGTELQLVFSRIPGTVGISDGVVEVVDAENDTVIASYNVEFSP